ncbi:MAG: hypothetical protein WCF24_12475 [Acidimicrobiales bacterium]
MNRRRTLATAETVLALGTVALLFGACGGGSSPGVASVRGSSTSTTIAGGAGNSGGPPTQAQLRAMLKFAQCARKKGLSNFPDPPYRAGELDNLGYTKYSPQMEKADRECHALALASGFVESKAEIEYYLQQDLKTSECMRAHGVTDFPDPSSKGGGPWPLNQSTLNQPDYSSAAKVCGAPPSAPPPRPAG